MTTRGRHHRGGPPAGRTLALDTIILALCVAMVLLTFQDENRLAIAGWAAAGIFHAIHVIARHTEPEDIP